MDLDDEEVVDEALYEELVFLLSPQNDCEQLLKALKQLSQEAVKGEHIAQSIRFVGCVGRCLKLAEYPDAEVADAACALLANLSGTAGVWGVERYWSYRSAMNAYTYKWRSGPIQLELERSSFVSAGLGYMGWPSADVLARMIREGVIDVRGQHVLELGCGIGIVGLVSAVCGAASVVMTDYHAVVLETAQRNAARHNLESKVTTCRLDWRHYLPADGELTGISAEVEYQYEQGSDAPSHGQGCPCVPAKTQYSLILASDCIYDEGHALLVPHVIDAFLSKTDPNAVCHVVVPLAKYRAGVADFARIIDHMFSVTMTADTTPFPSREDGHTLYTIRRRPIIQS